LIKALAKPVKPGNMFSLFASNLDDGDAKPIIASDARCSGSFNPATKINYA
jgi:hypothetical protein